MSQKEVKPEAEKGPEKSKNTEKFRLVTTLGSAWSDIFESSLSRKLSKIYHAQLGKPTYRLDPNIFDMVVQELGWNSEQEKAAFYNRLVSKSKQASELEFKFNWHVANSTHLLIDSAFLDTAIGHHLLVRCREYKKPVWAVSVDDRSSPLAAAYLKGIIFPSSADDLVALVLQNS